MRPAYVKLGRGICMCFIQNRDPQLSTRYWILVPAVGLDGKPAPAVMLLVSKSRLLDGDGNHWRE